MILPGKTIGVLGGGPLGRMLAQAAQTLGYRVHVFEPQVDCPASAVANLEGNASYEDVEGMKGRARCESARMRSSREPWRFFVGAAVSWSAGWISNVSFR